MNSTSPSSPCPPYTATLTSTSLDISNSSTSFLFIVYSTCNPTLLTSQLSTISLPQLYDAVFDAIVSSSDSDSDSSSSSSSSTTTLSTSPSPPFSFLTFVINHLTFLPLPPQIDRNLSFSFLYRLISHQSTNSSLISHIADALLSIPATTSPIITTPRPRSIYNPASTCYINSVLLQLYHTPRFLLFITSLPPSALLTNLQGLFAKLTFSIRPYVDASEFYNSYAYPEVFKHEALGDVSAFYTDFMYKLNPNSTNSSFGCKLSKTVTFDSSDTTPKYTNESFNMLSLPLKPTHASFVEVLSSFTSSAIITGTNPPASVTTRMCHPLPLNIVFYLQRVTFDVGRGGKVKSVQSIALEEVLEVDGRFCDDDGVEATSPTPTTSLPSPMPNNNYILSGVIIHEGSSSSPSSSSDSDAEEQEEGGHVYSCIKINGEWWKLNDDDDVVVVVDPFGDEMTGKVWRENAVMLFYRKADDDCEVMKASGEFDVDVAGLSSLTVIGTDSEKDSLSLLDDAMSAPPEISQDNKTYVLKKSVELDLEYKAFLATLLPQSINALLLGLSPSALIGKRVEVKWKTGWFVGVISEFCKKDGRFSVLYEDGERKRYALHKKEFSYI